MNTFQHRLYPWGVLILLVVTPLFGQTAVAVPSFSGTLETGWGWFYQSTDLAVTGPHFEGKLAGAIGSAESPSGQYSVAGRLSLDSAGATTFNLGEAWARGYLGPLDLSVGNQSVSWGVTDVFTPLDVVNPRDQSHPMDSLKLPVPLVRVALSGAGWSLDSVLVPAFAKSVLPETRWQTSPAFSPPNGITVVGRTLVDHIPSLTWDNLAWGGRLGVSFDVFQGLDLGLTVYQGRNPLPRPTVSLVATATQGQKTAQTTFDYDRFTLGGMDFVLAAEGLVLRAEAAGRVWRGADFANPASGDASAQGVASVEFTLPVIGVKALLEGVADWANTSAWEGTTRAKAVAVLSAVSDSRWSWKAIGAWDLEGAGMASPQVTYVIADGLSATAILFAFFGDSSVSWGAWYENSVAEATLKYAF